MSISMEDYKHRLDELSHELKDRIHGLEEDFSKVVAKELYEKAKNERVSLEAKQALS